MYSSQFDGGAFGSSSQSTQSPDSSLSKSRGTTSSTTPLTVKQIMDAYESSSDKSNFQIDGVDVGNIVILGLVCNKAARATDVTFTIDDGTGRMDFIRWVNEASDLNETAVMQNGMYVSIVGNLKGFGERKRATAFAIRLVEDHNRIVLHFIQCIRIHIENTKSKIGNFDQSQSTLVKETLLSTPTSNKGSSVNNASNASETDIYKLVLDFFQEPEVINNEQGIHVDAVVMRLGLPADKIKEAIAYHVDMGFIYSSIDEFHFKYAESL